MSWAPHRRTRQSLESVCTRVDEARWATARRTDHTSAASLWSMVDGPYRGHPEMIRLDMTTRLRVSHSGRVVWAGAGGVWAGALGVGRADGGAHCRGAGADCPLGSEEWAKPPQYPPSLHRGRNWPSQTRSARRTSFFAGDRGGLAEGRRWREPARALNPERPEGKKVSAREEGSIRQGPPDRRGPRNRRPGGRSDDGAQSGWARTGGLGCAAG